MTKEEYIKRKGDLLNRQHSIKDEMAAMTEAYRDGVRSKYGSLIGKKVKCYDDYIPESYLGEAYLSDVDICDIPAADGIGIDVKTLYFAKQVKNDGTMSQRRLPWLITRIEPV